VRKAQKSPMSTWLMCQPWTGNTSNCWGGMSLTWHKLTHHMPYDRYVSLWIERWHILNATIPGKNIVTPKRKRQRHSGQEWTGDTALPAPLNLSHSAFLMNNGCKWQSDFVFYSLKTFSFSPIFWAVNLFSCPSLRLINDIGGYWIESSPKNDNAWDLNGEWKKPHRILFSFQSGQLSNRKFSKTMRQEKSWL